MCLYVVSVEAVTNQMDCKKNLHNLPKNPTIWPTSFLLYLTLIATLAYSGSQAGTIEQTIGQISTF